MFDQVEAPGSTKKTIRGRSTSYLNIEYCCDDLGNFQFVNDIAFETAEKRIIFRDGHHNLFIDILFKDVSYFEFFDTPSSCIDF